MMMSDAPRYYTAEELRQKRMNKRLKKDSAGSPTTGSSGVGAPKASKTLAVFQTRLNNE
jgi:hypothetical protein